MNDIFYKLLAIAGDLDGSVTSANYNGTDYCSVQIEAGGAVLDFTVIKKEGGKRQ